MRRDACVRGKRASPSLFFEVLYTEKAFVFLGCVISVHRLNIFPMKMPRLTVRTLTFAGHVWCGAHDTSRVTSVIQNEAFLAEWTSHYRRISRDRATSWTWPCSSECRKHPGAHKSLLPGNKNSLLLLITKRSVLRWFWLRTCSECGQVVDVEMTLVFQAHGHVSV